MNRIWRALAAALVCAAMFLAAAPVGLAWEEDVHYLLTFWLADKAGFSRQDADDIASGDQSMDEGSTRAAIQTVLWIVLTGDQIAARDLQLRHFPHDARLPSPALRRVVAPNNQAARDSVEKEIRPTNGSLLSLGEAFHPFQDSWSHQGVPDVPFNWHADLVSAHPKARGGWRSHDADLTHLHVNEVVDAARETYALMLEFLKKNPKRVDHSSAEWKSLEPLVRDFASASTQDAKAAWASKNVPRSAAAASTIANLTLSGRRSFEPFAVSLAPPAKSRSAVAVEPALVVASQRFLDDWMVKGDVATAVNTVNWGRLREQFGDDPRAQDRSFVIEWCEKFLVMQLAANHAEVNRLGHGDPDAPGFRQFRRNVADANPAEVVRMARVAIDPSDFFSTDVAGDGGVGLVLRMASAPHDAVTLVFQRDPAGWRVVRMFAMPMESARRAVT